jgi:L-asparaginase/Glu-tRNA(Gln) amidotransferase subunit D
MPTAERVFDEVTRVFSHGCMTRGNFFIPQEEWAKADRSMLISFLPHNRKLSKTFTRLQGRDVAATEPVSGKLVKPENDAPYIEWITPTETVHVDAWSTDMLERCHDGEMVSFVPARLWQDSSCVKRFKAHQVHRRKRPSGDVFEYPFIPRCFALPPETETLIAMLTFCGPDDDDDQLELDYRTGVLPEPVECAEREDVVFTVTSWNGAFGRARNDDNAQAFIFANDLASGCQIATGDDVRADLSTYQTPTGRKVNILKYVRIQSKGKSRKPPPCEAVPNLPSTTDDETPNSPSDGRRGRAVLLLYTGGTFGCAESEAEGKVSLNPVNWAHMFFYLRSLRFFNPAYQDREGFELQFDGPHRKRNRHVVTYRGLCSTIDSTDTAADHWNLIANEVIRAEMSLYDGVVIIHGTDTLHYTASALTFMLPDLKISVVITGAQSSIFSTVNDSASNLRGALQAVCHEVVCGAVAKTQNTSKRHPSDDDEDHEDDSYDDDDGATIDDNTSEQQRDPTKEPQSPAEDQPAGPRSPQLWGVYVYFNYKLMIGCRVVKQTSTDYDAFDSPNMGVVAVARQWHCGAATYHFVFDEQLLHAHNEGFRKFHELRDAMESDDDAERAAAIRKAAKRYPGYVDQDRGRFAVLIEERLDVRIVSIHPCISLKHMCRDPPDGLVIRAYGSGNVPEAIQSFLAVNMKDTPVATVTECFQGSVASAYAVQMQQGALCNDATLSSVFTEMCVAITRHRRATQRRKTLKQFVERILGHVSHFKMTSRSSVEEHCRGIASYGR